MPKDNSPAPDGKAPKMFEDIAADDGWETVPKKDRKGKGKGTSGNNGNNTNNQDVNPDPPRTPTWIGGKKFSIHEQERMWERKISNKEALAATKSDKTRPGSAPGSTQHFDPESKVVVVVASDGVTVITTFRKNSTPAWAR